MVTQDRQYVKIEVAEKIIMESKNQKEMVERLHSLTKRQPRGPVPPGSISLREAARKYGIPNPTISRWVKRGLIKVILRTKNWLYIDESDLNIFLTNRNN